MPGRPLSKRVCPLRLIWTLLRIECESYHLSSCDLKPLRPAPHWAVTLGNVALIRKNIFRIRLLVGCDVAWRVMRLDSRHIAQALGLTTRLVNSVVLPVRMLGTIAYCSTLSLTPPRILRSSLGSCLARAGHVDGVELQTFCIDFLDQLKSACLHKLSGPIY